VFLNEQQERQINGVAVNTVFAPVRLQIYKMHGKHNGLVLNIFIWQGGPDNLIRYLLLAKIMISQPAITKNKTIWLHLAMIAVCVLLAYCKVFNASFLSWDDSEYVVRNKDIVGINVTNIKAWFTGFYVGNYHPLTMLSYALDYVIGATSPVIYHASNILLHIGNAIIVYLLVKRLQPQVMVALVVALIFALHPSQTESVSWIAERKTVLSALFYLLALLQYVRYAGSPSAGKMIWVIVAAGAAMLSKGTAVALPLSLIAIDVWLQRPLNNKRIWLEKAVILVLAVITGLVAIQAQESGKFLDTHAPHTGLETLIFAGYAYTEYIVRFFVPLGLSAMYPYPTSVGLVQYLFAIVAVALVVLSIISYRKRWHVLCGGLFFYSVNIVLVLQLIQFGEALMADRYMYIACLGIAYPAAHYSFAWLQQKGRQIAIKAITALVALLLAVTTFARNEAWRSDFNFFNALLATFPNSAVTQYSVGALYLQKGDFAQAEIHLDKAVRIDPRNYKAWHNKGTLYLRQGRAMEALEALDKSVAINGYPKAYFTRALLHHSTGRMSLALADIEQTLKAQPQNAKAWLIKGNCLEQTGDIQGALECYNKSIGYDDKEPLAFMRRGLIFSKTKQLNLAIEDLEAATAMNPNSADGWYYLGMAKHQAGQNGCSSLRHALQLGQAKAQEALEKFCK
jgi:protein O-mannosyl-transferase